MHISRVVVRNYRNFSSLDCSLNSGVTSVIGENNTGKTNLLHAIRLVIDSELSSTYRKLSEFDLHAGEDFTVPNQVLIALELTDYKGNVNQQALVGSWEIEENLARIVYRYRPRQETRDAIAANEHSGTALTLEDYHWEISGGGGDKDPLTLEWDENCGSTVRFGDLQSFQVILLPAIRDVQADLRQSRVSPLARLLEASNIPQEEKEALTAILGEANTRVSETATIKEAGSAIDTAFNATAGDAFKFAVRLGMADPSFAAIARSLTVLLTTDAMSDFETSRNGLGLNNILYISMLLEYFDRRIENSKTAGQLLLIEEPEAHLHPQLQRVLYSTLAQKAVQTILTTHSTHLTSLAPLSSFVVLTNDGTSASCGCSLVHDTAMSTAEVADLERYLDATRSTLLYARRVILVEGPAELFLIPAMVKAVRNIDLTRLGISVVPIHGTHFKTYAQLFGENGMTKRCAIITDGDLLPSDADPGAEPEDGVPVAENLMTLENDHVKVFQCTTTFERELTRRGSIELLRATAADIPARRLEKRLAQFLLRPKPATPEQQAVDRDMLNDLGGRVLATAKAVGKARFAQIAARHANLAKSLPKYIDDAITWILEP